MQLICKKNDQDLYVREVDEYPFCKIFTYALKFFEFCAVIECNFWPNK